jgi:hypothetical protein
MSHADIYPSKDEHYLAFGDLDRETITQFDKKIF